MATVSVVAIWTALFTFPNPPDPIVSLTRYRFLISYQSSWPGVISKSIFNGSYFRKWFGNKFFSFWTYFTVSSKFEPQTMRSFCRIYLFNIYNRAIKHFMTPFLYPALEMTPNDLTKENKLAVEIKKISKQFKLKIMRAISQNNFFIQGPLWAGDRKSAPDPYDLSQTWEKIFCYFSLIFLV